ncbi:MULTISPECIES: saccharopine dehydrogenase family protein [unclassified Bartonella]|uniref:saccharopine dehydrogenase family protein n=1 Tax=unclassified Bartonella TaxID=2645622 RepID=UPI000999E0F1|nr:MULTISPECIES: saccharopine dehydrogenase family protein [unclassified Bartonella]AQX19016.1 carboxynorspermidine dehydrogenase [Bartonella sp. A1379B]AQX22239.1 Saccharopine dehydrogenase, NADP-dependent [Bartonella sp. 11B]AQX24478.1 Saccharopine dehydrogenase, NADP-dependent [Bartonella sp. 114]AQX26008.1 carboxynorspermidine dehydrogenase [Bartonella sp. Coyote22sub2]
MKKNVLIIGAGGVAQVVAHKCAQNNDLLGEIHIASRTQKKCDAIIASIQEKKATKVEDIIKSHTLNAMDVEETVKLIQKTKCEIVINVGSSFLNMSVLSACIETKCAYIDTAIHEDPLKICETPPWYGNYEWPRRQECEKAGITAILGAGFDPGVVNAYAALARDSYFDTITDIDIIDINAGNHGRWFATNFDPEINFREFTGQVWSWQNKKWTSNQMFEIRHEWDLPVVGKQTAYMTGHDEIHSLSKNLDVPNIRFWMGFSERYITVFTVLKNLGLLSEQPIKTAEGQEVVPLKVVKAVLPDPASLAPNYTGKTCIGDLVKGTKNGNPREVFIYNIADHKQAFNETGAQGISYTAGVPAAATAMLIATGEWDVKTMVNIEELPPHPFLKYLDHMGLPTYVREQQDDKKLQF